MNIIGHHKERELLRKCAEDSKVSQSYLFIGPQSVGKSLCALEFACELVSEPDFVPNEDKPHPFDVLVMRPQEETKRGVTKTKSISADEIRDALFFLGRFPVSGRYRVAIIEDAHKLSLAAQNVLLKTLEEPNESAVMILVTHEAGSIVPTILSRVQRTRFDFVPEDEIVRGAEEAFPEEKRNEIAPFFYSLGRPGMIVRALDDPESFVLEREKLGKLFRLSALSLAERLQLSEKLSANVPETVRLLEWWLPGLHAQALKTGETKSAARYFLLLESVEQTLGLLKTTQSNARLLLDKLFLSL